MLGNFVKNMQRLLHALHIIINHSKTCATKEPKHIDLELV